MWEDVSQYEWHDPDWHHMNRNRNPSDLSIIEIIWRSIVGLIWILFGETRLAP